MGHGFTTTVFQLPDDKDRISVEEYEKRLPPGVQLEEINFKTDFREKRSWIEIGDDITLSMEDYELIDEVRKRHLL